MQFYNFIISSRTPYSFNHLMNHYANFYSKCSLIIIGGTHQYVKDHIRYSQNLDPDKILF